MSYSIVGTPDKFSPVYNPIYFYANSSNKNLEGFKYVIDIFSAGTPTRIGRYKLYPRPNDGYAVADINQLLTSQVSYYVNQDLNIISGATQDYVDYDVYMGEEYVKYWNFTSNSYVLFGSYAGYTAFYSSGNTHNYVVGDSVLVTQDAGYTYPQYNGIFTVINVPSTTQIIVNCLAQGITPPQGGNIVYSDKHKTLYSGITSAVTYTAYNAALGHQDFMNYAGSAYTFSVSNLGKFLTNAPSNYRVKSTNKMWLNYHTHSIGEAFKAVITTRYGTYELNNTLGSNKSIQVIGIGPANIQAAELLTGSTGQIQWSATTGLNPVFKDTCWVYDNVSSALGGFTNLNGSTQSPWYTAYTGQFISVKTPTGQIEYEIINTAFPNTITLNIPYTGFTGYQSGNAFQLTDYYSINFIGAIPFATSETKTFNLDYNVTPYGNIELYFIDRLGSMVPVNFELNSTRSISIDRNEYQTVLGDLSGGKWGYDSTARGRNILNTTVKKQIVLNTNWLTEAEASYMQELHTSPVVYIKERNKLWPVIIKSSGYEIKTKNNQKNIQISLTIEYANNDRIQNF